VRKEGATYEKGSIKGELLSQLKAISKAIQQGWEKYMNRKYNAPIRFQFLHSEPKEDLQDCSK
jgi:hypothetical protein